MATETVFLTLFRPESKSRSGGIQMGVSFRVHDADGCLHGSIQHPIKVLVIHLDDDHVLEAYCEPKPYLTYEREMHLSFDRAHPGLVLKEGSRFTMLPVGSSGRDPRLEVLTKFFRREFLPTKS